LTKQVQALLRILIYFVLFFAFWRIAFLLYNKADHPDFTFSEAAWSFIHGLRMDLSVISYILILPALLLMMMPIKIARYLHERLGKYFNGVIVVLTILLAANIFIFHFWGNLINYRALTYLSDTGQLLHSFSTGQIIVVVLFLALVIYLALYTFKKFCRVPKYDATNDKLIYKVGISLTLGFVLITGIRGGWQMLPMNESLVSRSSNNFLNQVTLNPAWHLMYEVQLAGLLEKNPFNKMDESVSTQLVNDLFSNDNDSFPDVLSKKDPNIVVIILESHTSDVVGVLGGEKNVSPFLDSLSKSSLLFNSVFSSGTRTDQGIVSILNGWPATPYHSIMRSTEKSKRLPSIPKDLKTLGYSTAFYYGGESNFSNMNLYLMNQTFDHVYDKKDFPANTPGGKWGVYDENLFKKQREDLSKTKEPFFSVMMTLSTHEPFDVPGEKRFPGNSEEDLFRNAAAYTDACVWNYLESVKNDPWYANTLFIILADHGHRLPWSRNDLMPEARRIPMLFYGDVLLTKFKGRQIRKLGGHHDLAATLLPQMGLSGANYKWSKNLLSTGSKEFAYYQSESVIGWKEGRNFYVYSYLEDRLLLTNIKDKQVEKKLVQRGQAFLQNLYGEYLSY